MIDCCEQIRTVLQKSAIQHQRVCTICLGGKW